MILKSSSNIDIETKKELYNFFKPNIITNENILLNNRESKLIRATKKNSSLLDLVNRLDLVEV